MKKPSVPCWAGVSSKRLARWRPQTVARAHRRCSLSRHHAKATPRSPDGSPETTPPGRRSPRQHRAGDVDEAAARLHQRRRERQDRPLLLLALRRDWPGVSRHLASGRRRQAPRAGAGRVDEDEVEARAERRQRLAVAGRQHLHVARACPLQALEDGAQAGGVVVVGVDLAGVLHGGGEGQRLAAGACANVEHLLARARRPPSARRSATLRPVPRTSLCRARPRPRRWVAGRAPSGAGRRTPQRRQRRRHRREPRQGLQHLLAVGLERVDPEIDRRSLSASAAPSSAAVGAEHPLEGGLQPIGEVAEHRGRAHRRAPRATGRPAPPRSAARPRAGSRRRRRSQPPATVPSARGAARQHDRARAVAAASGRRASGGGAGRRRPDCRWLPGRPSRQSGGSCPSRQARLQPAGDGSAPRPGPRWRP